MPPNPASATSQVVFDLLGRLDQVTGTGAGSFAWDTAGRLTGTAEGRSLQYDTAGQATTLTDPGADTTTAFAYDADGNRTSAATTTGTGTTGTVMGWDVAGHLTSHTTATTSTTYAYDATGLRTSASATTGGATTAEQYVWDTTGTVATLLADSTNTYVYGLDGTPLAQLDAEDDPVYLHTDLVGSVRTATGHDAEAVCDADYDPYGQPRPVTDDPCAQVTRFGYAGQYTDPTGLQYLRHRYYDPATAQFLSVDPRLDVTGDPYGYAGGNPLQNTDPLGLDWSDWVVEPGVRVLNAFGVSEGDVLRPVSNFFAGFGDMGSVGITSDIRMALGIDTVDYCSGWYLGGGAAGFVGAFALPAARGVSTAFTTARAATTASGASVASNTLPTPKVSSAKLQNLVDNLYKGTTNPNRVGNGTTMDAIRNEIATGVPTGGRLHTTKGQETLNGLNNWLRRNPEANYYDRQVAQSLADELSSVLRGAR
jgi:RHS repeat-associated protein